MKWHDHPMAWKSYAELMGIHGKPQQCVDNIVDVLARKGKWAQNTIVQIMGELKWTNNDRPYYDIYPSIAEAFTKVDLDRVQCQQIKLPVPELLVRFPVGHEVQGSKERRIRSILVVESVSTENKCPGWLIAVNDGSVEPINAAKIVVHSICGISLVPGTNISQRLAMGRANPYCEDVIDNEEVDTAVKIVATLCLLKDNPDLIEPLPLESDRQRWEETHDGKFIEKAKRRGKFGWAVGKKIEVCPGFRSPHFAIRWCGKGASDPQLRPVKGCIVHRDKVVETPTDWMGPDPGV